MPPGADYSSFRPQALPPPAGDNLEAPVVSGFMMLDRQLAAYAAYHRNPVNRLTRSAGLPR